MVHSPATKELYEFEFEAFRGNLRPYFKWRCGGQYSVTAQASSLCSVLSKHCYLYYRMRGGWLRLSYRVMVEHIKPLCSLLNTGGLREEKKRDITSDGNNQPMEII